MSSYNRNEQAELYLLRVGYVADAASKLRQAASAAIAQDDEPELTPEQRALLNRYYNSIFSPERVESTRTLLGQLKKKIQKKFNNKRS